MTDSNVPAVRTDPGRELARTDTDSWIQVLPSVGHLAERIAGTEFVPKSMRNSAPAVAAAILYGREVGLPPMTSLTQTHVIEGKPSMSAEAMRAMILAGGHELIFDEVTGASCTMRARRAGSEHWTTLSWTIDMARAAGLLGKSNWKSYPRAMLIARCTGDLARMVFPDVIHGFRSVEEMTDLGPDADDQGGPGEPVAGTTAVSRRRTAKKAAAKKPATTAPAALPAGPPLPGEDGYAEPTQTPGGGASDDRDGSNSTPDSSAGEQREGAPSSGPDAPEPESPVAPVADEPGSGVQTPQDPAGDSNASEVPLGEASVAQAPERPGPADQPEDSPPPSDGRPASKAQVRMVMAEFSRFDLTKDEDRDERLAICSTIVGRELESTNNLTKGEASTLIDTLARVKDRDGLYRLLDTIDEERAQRAKAEAGDDS